MREDEYNISRSPFYGMPLCAHRIQFDCEQCRTEDLHTENRRMQWFLQMRINQNNGWSLWEQYKELTEEFWERQGL